MGEKKVVICPCGRNQKVLLTPEEPVRRCSWCGTKYDYGAAAAGAMSPPGAPNTAAGAVSAPVRRVPLRPRVIATVSADFKSVVAAHEEFVFPRRCPCCFGPGQVPHSIAVSATDARMSRWTWLTLWAGVVTENTTTYRWTWPLWYCRACAAHLRLRDRAAMVAAVFGLAAMAAWCVLVHSMTRRSPFWVYALGVVPTVVVGALFFGLGLWIGRARSGESCTVTPASEAEPVTVRLLDGYRFQLRFTHPGYARAFVESQDGAGAGHGAIEQPCR